MNSHQTFVKKPVISGATARITARVIDEDGDGFKPDTLTMSVYDVTFTARGSSVPTTFPPFGATPLSDAIVNGRGDVDVLGACDNLGNVELVLEEDDTVVGVPSGGTPLLCFRRILFRWTWNSPERVGKHEVILTIAPDRETVAT